MKTTIENVKRALADLKQGKMVILVDDLNRENEGDLIIAAEKLTHDMMNFFIRQGTGIVCVSLPNHIADSLGFIPIVPPTENSTQHQTPFLLPIDARDDVTTGVSAADRVKTIHTLLKEDVKPDDFVKPGHVFPLLAKENGVFERRGHTEGALDLVKLANLKPVAVICEIMNSDGTMAKGEQLQEFAQTHNISILSIEDIFIYRLKYDSLFHEPVSAQIPLSQYGRFTLTVFKEKLSSKEHVVLKKFNQESKNPPLVRLHSSCLTGDLFGSEKCDCQDQLHYALERISQEGGMLIYLDQEGRGIGLLNKIKAYALQEQGYDTVEANEKLNLPIDCREYHLAANILHQHNLTSIRLLTNNPDKINSLKQYGIEDVQREEIPFFLNQNNQSYLQTKKSKLNHMIDLKTASIKENILS